MADFKQFTEQDVKNVIDNEDIKTLELLDQENYSFKLSHFTQGFESNHLEIVKFFSKVYKKFFDTVTEQDKHLFYIDPLSVAIESGNVESVKFLLSENFKLCSEHYSDACYSSKNTLILEFLRSLNSDWPKKLYLELVPALMSSITVKWFFDNGFLYKRFLSILLFTSAISKRRVDLFKWLFTVDCPYKQPLSLYLSVLENFKDDDDKSHGVCFEMLDYLHEKFSFNLSKEEDNRVFFLAFLRKNSFPLLLWLKNKGFSFENKFSDNSVNMAASNLSKECKKLIEFEDNIADELKNSIGYIEKSTRLPSIHIKPSSPKWAILNKNIISYI